MKLLIKNVYIPGKDGKAVKAKNIEITGNRISVLPQ